MTPKIILGRVGSRFLIATTLILSLTSVLILIIWESQRLAVIGEAGWAVLGAGVYALGHAISSLIRAIAQNPSDRGSTTEER